MREGLLSCMGWLSNAAALVLQSLCKFPLQGTHYPQEKITNILKQYYIDCLDYPLFQHP